jgi:DNA invertase Pin-like site-specific DNA recombinase
MTNTLMATLRAVDYLRVSTEEQAKGYGISYTGKKTAKFIERKGWALVETYADEGLSGSLEAHERPQLKRLMEDVHKTPRPFDMVVVNEGRVIGRTGRAFWKWVWALEDLGVFVAVVDGDFDNSTSGGRERMIDAAGYAEKERELIRKRTQGGIQEKAEEGGWPGGRTPYGWMVQNKGQKGLSRAVRDKAEHAVLYRAYQLMALKGKNAQQAALTLNSEGLFTREGKAWSNKNLLNKLKSEAVQQSRVTFRKESRSVKDRDGNLAWGTSVSIPLEPAFTDAELKQLKAALAQGSVARNASGAPEYPLSKRVKGACGRHYTGFHRPGIRGYRCSGKQELHAGAGICSCSQVSADLLEEAVWSRVCHLLGDADQLRELSRAWVARGVAGKVDYARRLKELDAQISEQTDTIDTMMVLKARQAAQQGLRGEAAVEAAERAVKPLQEALTELRKQRDEAAAWEAEARQADERARDLESLAKAASHRLDDLAADKRARLIALLNIQVTLTSDVPRACRGRKAGLPDFEVRGVVDPRLVTEHIKARFRGESCPHVPSGPSGVFQFRMRVAASLTSADCTGLADRRAA